MKRQTLFYSPGIIFFLLAITLLAACSRFISSEAPAKTAVQDSVPPTDIQPSVATPLPAPGITDTPSVGENMPANPTEPLPAAISGPQMPVAGIEVHSLAGISQSQAAGVYWIRRNALHWDWVETAEGERNWAALADLEQEMQAVSAAGMELILVVQYTPGWAQEIPGSACGPIRPDKLEAFGAFMRDVVARYSVPPFDVKFYELGNEPDVPYELVPGDGPFGCWIDLNDPLYNGGDYANFLKTVYPQVKAADPSAQVLIGGLLLDCNPLNPPQLSDGSSKDCNPSRFLEFALQSGAAENFDGVSFHAYDYYWGKPGNYSNTNWNSSRNTTGPVVISKARYLRSLLDYYGRTDAYLINTETALLCGNNGTDEFCTTDAFAQTKASYAIQSNTVAQAEGLWGNIWYSIAGWRGSGLVNTAGEPLPVHHAIRFNAEKLNGMAFSRQVTDYPGVVVYEFQQNGRRVWVLWSQDGEDHPITLPLQPTAAYDMLGSPLQVNADWVVTSWSMYLEWQE